MKSKISILILAAGASRRMKRVKQLLPWGNTSLIEHVVLTAQRTSADHICVVLGAHREQIRPKLNISEVSVIEHRNWEYGMGSSIAAGVKEILLHHEPEGILIVLCDQPLIDSTYLNTMIETFKLHPSNIIGTSYGSKIGVPALFGVSFYSALKKLSSTAGASKMIASNKQQCIALNPGGKELDLDTEEDYENINS